MSNMKPASGCFGEVGPAEQPRYNQIRLEQYVARQYNVPIDQVTHKGVSDVPEDSPDKYCDGTMFIQAAELEYKPGQHTLIGVTSDLEFVVWQD